MAKKASDGPIGSALKRTYRAEGGALTRGYLVQQGTADDQAKVGGAATRVLGVVDESVAAAGDAVSIVKHGECIAIAGGAVNAGQAVKSDNGKCVAADAADVEVAGFAVTSAAGDTDEFVLFVTPIQKRS